MNIEYPPMFLTYVHGHGFHSPLASKQLFYFRKETSCHDNSDAAELNQLVMRVISYLFQTQKLNAQMFDSAFENMHF